MTEEIRKKIDAARTKEQLEEIGRDLDTPIELDRRKNMDILQAELHAHLDQLEEGEDQTPVQDPEQQAQDDGDTQEQSREDAQANRQESDRNGKDTKRSGKRLRKGEQDGAKTQNVTSHARRPDYEGRMLQNSVTKVFFPYTAALAKKRNMREV